MARKCLGSGRRGFETTSEDVVVSWFGNEGLRALFLADAEGEGSEGSPAVVLGKLGVRVGELIDFRIVFHGKKLLITLGLDLVSMKSRYLRVNDKNDQR